MDSGACDPQMCRMVSTRAAGHATETFFRPPTSLVKSSPAWVDGSTDMAENLAPRIPRSSGILAGSRPEVRGVAGPLDERPP